MERRQFLGAALSLGGGLVAGLAAGQRGKARAVEQARYYGDDLLGQGEVEKVWYRARFVGQPVMDNQLLFTLGLAPSRLTDVGEVLDTATRIAPGDERSWFEAWLATAARVRGYGEEALQRGHRLSAASHLLRAGCYLRVGLMRYADRGDPRLVQATKDALQLHDQALALQGYHSAEVQIPYEGSALVGRMHYAPGVERGPLLVLHQGLHAWPEDTMWVVDGALARGIHVLGFHGPGQGASLRLHGHPFRPDWEVPVARVLDFALADSRVDPDRLMLMGLSFGGFLAPRAAAYEDRIRVLIADPGVLSWGASMLRHFEALPGLMALHAAGPAAFDQAINRVSAVWPDARWYFDDVSWKHGVATPHALIDALRGYDNTEGAPRIRARTLILDGVAEDATPGESDRLYARLRCEKTLIRFDAASAAQMHCQGGSTLLGQARLFDWVEEVGLG